ncbi:hypothetical protein FH972_017455 [Carpinus fangiana]|uniref:Membrane-associated kinase regulator 4 n=1 Tax=Carpinus fangiana TaxID=176857 RepID=A0A5N6RIZ4_9ROSI|nr:hypothetical protein FH972_017455 [Carpinus fangiana]
MATNQPSCNHGDEDYIDMEVTSSSNFFCYSITSPSQNREFEFQMTSLSHERVPKTSPADELFYKGKLLPLHLPPRLQMVRKIIQTSNTHKTEQALEEDHSSPFTTTPSNASSPLESRTISPSESSRVSCELNPDEYFFEWSINETSGLILGGHPKKSWSKKMKQIKKFLLGQKLKTSRAYLKSFFSKSGCADESSAKAASNVEAEIVSKPKGRDCQNKYMTGAKKNPSGKIDDEKCHLSNTFMKSIDREMLEDGFNTHRRSFSGVIQRHSATKSSSSSTSSSGSSSFSFGSNSLYDLQLLKRSCSASSEIETSIEGAIAHCKQSHQLFSSTIASRVGVS